MRSVHLPQIESVVGNSQYVLAHCTPLPQLLPVGSVPFTAAAHSGVSGPVFDWKRKYCWQVRPAMDAAHFFNRSGVLVTPGSSKLVAHDAAARATQLAWLPT